MESYRGLQGQKVRSRCRSGSLEDLLSEAEVGRSFRPWLPNGECKYCDVLVKVMWSTMLREQAAVASAAGREMSFNTKMKKRGLERELSGHAYHQQQLCFCGDWQWLCGPEEMRNCAVFSLVENLMERAAN